jgi:hypothetical protein
MRMWDDNAQFFVGEGYDHLPYVHQNYAKRRVPLDALAGSFAPAAAPLGAVIAPVRSDEMGTTIQLELAGPQQAAMSVLSNSLGQASHARPDRQAARLRQGTALCERVPVFKLQYPAGYLRLDEVVSAVLSKLADFT